MKTVDKKVFEGWSGKEGEEAFGKMLAAFNEMTQEDILRMLFAYMSYKQLKKFYEYMDQDGYFEGMNENVGIVPTVKRSAEALARPFAGGEALFNKMLAAFNKMEKDEILTVLFNCLEKNGIESLDAYMDGWGAYNGVKEGKKTFVHVKRVNEMNSDNDYAYLDYLNMEVKLYDNIEDFAKQFDDVDTAKLYDFVDKVYDHVEGDEMPGKNDRDNIMEYVYLYATEVAKYE